MADNALPLKPPAAPFLARSPNFASLRPQAPMPQLRTLQLQITAGKEEEPYMGFYVPGSQAAAGDGPPFPAFKSLVETHR